MSRLATVRQLLSAPALSPLGFLLWAARLSGVLLLLHRLGAREATSVLSGTRGSVAEMFVGLAYTFTYFVCAAFTVPLLVSAALTAGLARLSRRAPRMFEVGQKADVC